MKKQPINIGNVVGSTSPLEFRFSLKRFAAKLGDLVNVEIDIPSDESAEEKRKVLVWARITELHRFNPFLPAEAGVELADEGLDLLQPVGVSVKLIESLGHGLVKSQSVWDLRRLLVIDLIDHHLSQCQRSAPSPTVCSRISHH